MDNSVNQYLIFFLIVLNIAEQNVTSTILKILVKVFSELNQAVIINCAAYTDVNNSEIDIKKALKINSIAVKAYRIVCKYY